MDEVDTLLNGKHRVFSRIQSDRYDDLVKQFNRPLDDIYMSVRDRVKGPRINCDSFFFHLQWRKGIR